MILLYNKGCVVVCMKKIMEISKLNEYGFNDFNLNIESNKHVSIIGPNMCGKTTLFRIMTGIMPTDNCVKCNNVYLNRQNVNKYIQQIGIVFPCNDGSFLHDNVLDELRHPLLNLGYNSFYIDKAINHVLSIFNLDIKDKMIKDLTNLEKQELLFCLALVHEPKVLLINEVFDYINKDDSLKILDILKKLNITIINFSVNLDFANNFDYLYIMNKREILYSDTPKKY